MRLSCSSLDLLLSSLQTSVGALPRCTGGRRIVAVAAGGSLRSRRWRPYQQLIQKRLKKTHHGTRTLEGQCDRSTTFQKILLRSRSYQKKKKRVSTVCSTAGLIGLPSGGEGRLETSKSPWRDFLTADAGLDRCLPHCLDGRYRFEPSRSTLAPSSGSVCTEKLGASTNFS